MNLTTLVTRHSMIVLSALVACFWMCTGMAWAQGTATIQGLGDLSGGGFGSRATGVSADGAAVVGVSNGSNGEEAFRWEGGTMVGLGELSGGNFQSSASGISGDGSVVVGSDPVTPPPFVHTGAFRWTEGSGMLGLGFIGSGVNSWATGVSANGAVVVGTGTNSAHAFEAFRWEGGTMVGLGDLPGGYFTSEAYGVSADGAVVVGNSVVTDAGGREAFLWTAATGMVGLGDLPGGANHSIAFGISADRSVVVGYSLSINGHEAFLWTATTGMVGLGMLPGISPFSEANGTSADGRVVVGVSNGEAFIWTAANGMRSLRDVLVEQGVDMTDWTLSGATAVSADGLVIVGYGTNPQSQLEGWIATLPPPDTDGDGLLDDWETNGIPYTDIFSAEQRYLLDFDGNPGSDCNSNRKDIFIEIDSMNGFEPSPATFISVKAAFHSAPVNNPNGAASGIKLHVILDDDNIPVGDWTKDDTNGNGNPDWPTEFDALKLTASSGTFLSGYFGTTTERDDPDGTAIREAKAKAFRYCIFGRSLDSTATSSGPSGIAEIGGNDFAVTMGLWVGGGTLNEHAGTFMHELGHTLGLRHGGGDDILYKPNYYSVMNYSFQTPLSWMPTGTWPLDPNRGGYSKFALPTLNENALTECSAQVVPGSSLAGTIFISSYVDGQGLVNEWFGRYDHATDWNNSQGPCENPIAVDINRLMIIAGFPVPAASPGESLIGHDDWAALLYNFRNHPSFAPGVHNPGLGESAVIDITFEENQALANALPPFCAGEIVSDRNVNVDDLLAVITNWGACPSGCLADIAPLPADGQVNVDDLLLVITNWGPCR